MNAVTIDIKDFITANIPKWVFGQNLFIARMPDQPNTCVTLYDINGTRPDLGLKKELYFRDAFQVVVRDVNYQQAMDNAWELIDVLQGQYGLEFNGRTYTLISVLLTPEVLEWDTKNRVSLIFSMEAQRK